MRKFFVVNFSTFLKHFWQPNTTLVENPSSLLFSYVSLSLISCSLSQLKTHSISQLKTKSLPSLSLSLSLSNQWVGLYLISLSLNSMVKIAVVELIGTHFHIDLDQDSLVLDFQEARFPPMDLFFSNFYRFGIYEFAFWVWYLSRVWFFWVHVMFWVCWRLIIGFLFVLFVF